MTDGGADLRDDELVLLERRFWLEGGGNPDFWSTHFADDGLIALPFGIMDKNQTLEAMGHGDPWDDVDMQDLRIVPIADTSALVTYRASGRQAGEAEEYRAVIGSLYVQRDGTWQLLFHQQSPMSEGGG